MTMKTIIFYHDDPDGACSAAIVCQRFWGEAQPVCVAVDYKDPFPFEAIDGGDEVYVLDFSLGDAEQWRRLSAKAAGKLIWIDHHKTAIEKAPKDIVIHGKREVGVAACELTWRYFHPGMNLPLIVEMIADWDVWRFKHGDATRDLRYGLDAEDLSPDGPFWRDLLITDLAWEAEYPFGVRRIIQNGKLIRAAMAKRDAAFARAYGHEVEFEGRRTFVMNARGSSEMFRGVEGLDRYGIMAGAVCDGARWTVNMYTTREDVDVGEIAKRHGGGGHRKAAGFMCEELPWTKREEKDLYSLDVQIASENTCPGCAAENIYLSAAVAVRIYCKECNWDNPIKAIATMVKGLQ